MIQNFSTETALSRGTPASRNLVVHFKLLICTYHKGTLNKYSDVKKIDLQIEFKSNAQ